MIAKKYQIRNKIRTERIGSYLLQVSYLPVLYPRNPKLFKPFFWSSGGNINRSWRPKRKIKWSLGLGIGPFQATIRKVR